LVISSLELNTYVKWLKKVPRKGPKWLGFKASAWESTTILSLPPDSQLCHRLGGMLTIVYYTQFNILKVKYGLMRSMNFSQWFFVCSRSLSRILLLSVTCCKNYSQMQYSWMNIYCHNSLLNIYLLLSLYSAVACYYYMLNLNIVIDSYLIILWFAEVPPSIRISERHVRTSQIFIT
jgi:hypothetical protein